MIPKNIRCKSMLAIFSVLFILAAPASQAALMTYAQDFEALDQSDGSALANDSWLVGANVFDPSGTFLLYNYFSFVAPNGGDQFSAVAAGEGGLEQGNQQFSVFSDYGNASAHNAGQRVEANVFQQQTISTSDAGSTWAFSFDAKQGNIEGASTALAFVKTLDPGSGFVTTSLITVDTTSIGNSWTSFELLLFVDSSMDGQLLQFGFVNDASNYEGSGVFYDNIRFQPVPVPAAVWLFVSALAGLASLRRKR